jgi:hypothetical protein
MMKELKDISDRNPFKVPENYFEEVNRKIISSTTGFSSVTKEKSLYRKLKPYLAVAASVTALVILSFTAVYIFSSDKNKTGLPEITLSEFSDNYLDDMDLLTLEESAGYIAADVTGTDINSAEIIDYLTFENIDIIDIYEQL